MKFLKSWLQDYIVERLPDDEVLADTLNKKAFEVEETTHLSGDTIYDIKVLPNRAHDALCHRGMARELCTDFGYAFKEDKRVEKNEDFFYASVTAPSIAIEDAKMCTRFMGMRIDGVTVGESPDWLKNRLEAIGQRSINNIVDITNYVQFALNKPMHAYDTRSIEGALCARLAQKGEKLMTLDDKDLILDEKILVIADDKKVLGLAGIKGGKYSGINHNTTSIILESANFAPSLIRRTSERYGARSDASKRFENGIANSLVEEGLYMTTNLIKELCVNAKGSEVMDVYPRKDATFKVGISVQEVNSILGASYTSGDIEKTLGALMFQYEKVIPEQKLQEIIPAVLDKPYDRLASTLYDGPNKFSCGSLVNWLYKECGYPTPRIAIDMYVWSKHIPKEELRLGDIVFTNTKVERPKDAMIYSKVLGKEIKDVPNYTKTIEFLRGTEFAPGIDHVGMYIGNGKVLHTGSMIGKVMTEDLGSSDYFKNECWYGRFMNDLSVEQYVISVPSERLDIRIKEDAVEEIGRILGYENLVPVLPNLSRVGLVHKRMYYENKIREILVANGFSEVMTYSFGNVGEVSIVKGLADDKEKLRANLAGGISESLKLNFHNAPLLGQKVIRIFEFGNVFTKSDERHSFTIGIQLTNKSKDWESQVDSIFEGINNSLKNIFGQTFDLFRDYSSSVPRDRINQSQIYEIDNFDALIAELPEPVKYEAPTFVSLPRVIYKSVSPYPFALRDIAVFVPSGTDESEVKKIIESEAGDLLVRNDLFDKFEKGGKISYAFHLVFQSYEKTLSDDELNGIMDKITGKLNSETGWQVR